MLKLTWRPEWNGLSLSVSDFADSVARLSLAPTQGNRRSPVPAPIYWANAIVAAIRADLRFRGQYVLPVSAGVG